MSKLIKEKLNISVLEDSIDSYGYYYQILLSNIKIM